MRPPPPCPTATCLAQGPLGGARVEGRAVGVAVASVGVGVAVGPSLHVATSGSTRTRRSTQLRTLGRVGHHGPGTECTLQEVEDEAA